MATTKGEEPSLGKSGGRIRLEKRAGSVESREAIGQGAGTSANAGESRKGIG